MPRLDETEWDLALVRFDENGKFEVNLGASSTRIRARFDEDRERVLPDSNECEVIIDQNPPQPPVVRCEALLTARMLLESWDSPGPTGGPSPGGGGPHIGPGGQPLRRDPDLQE